MWSLESGEFVLGYQVPDLEKAVLYIFFKNIQIVKDTFGHNLCAIVSVGRIQTLIDEFIHEMCMI